MTIARSILLSLLFTISACSAPSPDTWREGHKQAYAQALTFKSWSALWDWAESGSTALIASVHVARSEDLSGGRHWYVNTRQAGKKDACISILDEMRFIGNHNSGDTAHFHAMMRDWIAEQNPDEIIPPGHF